MTCHNTTITTWCYDCDEAHTYIYDPARPICLDERNRNSISKLRRDLIILEDAIKDLKRRATINHFNY